MKTLLVLASILYLSCQRKPSKRISEQKQGNIEIVEDKIQKKTKDSVSIKKNILKFLTIQQELLKSNKIDKLADHILFPLDGDVLYHMIYGDEFLEFPDKFFEKKIDRKTFIKKNDLIYPNFHKELMFATDFSKELYDDVYSFRKKDDEGILWEIGVGINYENGNFSINFNIVTDNSEEEYTIFYKYSEIENKYLLSYIGGAG